MQRMTAVSVRPSKRIEVHGPVPPEEDDWNLIAGDSDRFALHVGISFVGEPPEAHHVSQKTEQPGFA
jgi:hypothetical protein